MNAFLALLGIVTLLAGALWLHARSNRRLVERRLAEREPLSAAEFGRRFFTETQAPIAAGFAACPQMSWASILHACGRR